MDPHLIEILLVEDNPADVRLTRELLSDAKIMNRLENVGDGVEALQYLRKTDEYTDSVRPDLILLDLNMPRMNGLELLEQLKQDDDLKAIPVIVLTTSQSEEDVYASYAQHASAFISKPVDLQQFSRLVKAVDDFWFSVVRLPGKQSKQ